MKYAQYYTKRKHSPGKLFWKLSFEIIFPLKWTQIVSKFKIEIYFIFRKYMSVKWRWKLFNLLRLVQELSFFMSCKNKVEKYYSV